MNRCPITYRTIAAGSRYSDEGLKLLSRRLRGLRDFPYSADEQRREAVSRAAKMSVQGVQPKLSARLNVQQELFDVVDTGGEYILKPQTNFFQVPENEDLTMRLAKAAGIEVPLHGLIYSKDQSFTYFIRRFDRPDRNTRLGVEDFAQLSQRKRDTKYDSSMENVVSVINEYATFPAVEKLKLFRITLFNFLVGNEDMHLKNFSLIRRESKTELTPAYDLLNTTIALENVSEEIALPIRGTKKNLSRPLLVKYFGAERLGLTNGSIQDVLTQLESAWATWETLISESFLSSPLQAKYRDLVVKRRHVLEM